MVRSTRKAFISCPQSSMAKGSVSPGKILCLVEEGGAETKGFVVRVGWRSARAGLAKIEN